MKIASNAIVDFGYVAEMERVAGSTIPAFCIGSIKPENLSEIIAVGARRCVVVFHLLTFPDISSATFAMNWGIL